jgi:RNA polymerase sigma-70 factor (ECF subfamily)
MEMEDRNDVQALNAVVTRARSGDEVAVAELVSLSRGAALRHALSRLGDRGLAEDVAQESLLLAVRSLDQLRHSEAFIGWLRTIVARQCDRVTRRARVVVVPLSDVVEPTDAEPQPDELVARAEQALMVRAVVDRLPAAQRDAVAAYYLAEQTQAEAAGELGISVSTINNRLHIARNTLKRKLADMNDTPDTPDTVTTAAISEDDRDKVYEALDTTGAAGPQWRQGRLGRSTFDWDTSRIAADASNVAGIVGVYDLTMRIGTSTVRTAGFNLDYLADPADQATMERLVAETVAAARDAGYGLAVSVGVTTELRAAGFVPAWPHLMWFVPTDALPATDAPECDDFEPAHRDDLAVLCDAEHAGLTGTVVRPTYLANKEPGGFDGRLWTDPGTGSVAGYVSYATVESWTNRLMLGPAHRGYDQLLWHDESAGDPDTRLAALAALAREHDCSEVAFDRLHPRSRLADQLRRLPHRIEQGYRQYGTTVLSLDTTIRSVRTTLDERLQRSVLADHDIDLRITVEDDSVALRGRAGDLEVAVATGDETQVIAGDQRVTQLVVGSAPLDSALAEEVHISDNALALAHTLFPAQEPQMGNQGL